MKHIDTFLATHSTAPPYRLPDIPDSERERIRKEMKARVQRGDPEPPRLVPDHLRPEARRAMNTEIYLRKCAATPRFRREKKQMYDL